MTFPRMLDPVYPLLDEETRGIFDSALDFAERQIIPHVLEWDEDHRVPSNALRELTHMGYYGTVFPEEYGGTNLSMTAQYASSRGLAYGDVGITVPIGVHGNLAGKSLLALTKGEKWAAWRTEWLPRFASGDYKLCFGLTEPDAGSNPRMMKSTCKKDGDDYILNGTKTYISAAVNSTHIVVFVNDERMENGISAFLVDLNMPGVDVGKPFRKMGIHTSETSEVSFQDARVPADRLIGEPGGAWEAAKGGLHTGRIGVCAQAVGLSYRALRLAFDSAKDRKLTRAKGGRKAQTVLDMQATQHKFAEMVTALVQADLLGYHAAQAYDRDDPAKEGLISAAKLAGPAAAQFITDECLQIMGGFGYMAEASIEKLVRDARVLRIYEGSSEVHKNVLGALATMALGA